MFIIIIVCDALYITRYICFGHYCIIRCASNIIRGASNIICGALALYAVHEHYMQCTNIIYGALDIIWAASNIICCALGIICGASYTICGASYTICCASNIQKHGCASIIWGEINFFIRLYIDLRFSRFNLRLPHRLRYNWTMSIFYQQIL
jgi:hypothetical protein